MTFIENPITVQDLRNIYNSELYQSMLNGFNNCSVHKLIAQKEVSDISLSNIQRRYLILNIPFEEVTSGFQKWQEGIVNYAINSAAFFMIEPDDMPDGEFPEGEEPGEKNRSTDKETLGVSRTWLLDKFCEFYLLQTGDKELLSDFLKASRMPGAKKYQRDITKLYNQIME